MYDSSLYFIKSYFINDRSQTFIIFQQNLRTFSLTETIVAWKCKGLSNEKKASSRSNNSLLLKLRRYHSRISLKVVV